MYFAGHFIRHTLHLVLYDHFGLQNCLKFNKVQMFLRDFVHVELVASQSCCRFVTCTSMMQFPFHHIPKGLSVWWLWKLFEYSVLTVTFKRYSVRSISWNMDIKIRYYEDQSVPGIYSPHTHTFTPSLAAWTVDTSQDRFNDVYTKFWLWHVNLAAEITFVCSPSASRITMCSEVLFCIT